MRENDALYLAWKLSTNDSAEAEEARRLLSHGETMNLYRLLSWVIVGGEVRALLTPDASLETIAATVWGGTATPLAGRWICGTDACVRMSREIETAPVAMGLAPRPEQWLWTSASAE